MIENIFEKKNWVNKKINIPCHNCESIYQIKCSDNNIVCPKCNVEPILDHEKLRNIIGQLIGYNEYISGAYFLVKCYYCETEYSITPVTKEAKCPNIDCYSPLKLNSIEFEQLMLSLEDEFKEYVGHI